jgi:predicted Zn-dependent protease
MVTSTISNTTLTSPIVSGGTIEQVVGGGKIISATILSGGSVTASLGGIAVSSLLSSGALQTIGSGGTASSTNLLPGAFEQVLNGGREISTTVSNGGVAQLSSGALVNNLTVVNGGKVVISGGTQAITATGGATISTLGTTNVSVSGNTSNNTIVLGGPGTLQVTGFDYVQAVSGATIVGGINCNLNIVNGGNVISLTAPGDYVGLVSGSGSVVIANSGTIGTGSGVAVTVNGNANTIRAPNAQAVISGLSDIVVASGGVVSALDNTTFAVIGGSTINETILLGNRNVVSVTGAAWISAPSGATIVGGASCNLNIVTGGNVISLTGPSDYVGLVAGSGNVVIGNNGSIGLGAGILGTVSGNGNTIRATSASVVISGAANTVIASGGATISMASNSNLAVVGSNDVISMGGGGTLTVAGNDQIAVNGTDVLHVTSGSTAQLTLQNAATLAVDGYIRLAAGTGTSASVNFTSAGGTIEIDGTTMPRVTLGGFLNAGTIDLRNVSLNTSLSPTISGSTLSVYGSDGTAYNIQLDPSQVYNQSNVAETSDGNGGVNVTISNGASSGSGVWLAGAAYSLATADYLSGIRDLLYSGDFSATGATVLHMDEWNIAYYTPVMTDIANYCNAHGIKIAVETQFNPGFSNIWMAAALYAGLPVAYVEDDSEPFNTVASQSDLNNDIAAVPALVSSYQTQLSNILSYFPNVQVGSWNEVAQANVPQASWDNLSVAYYSALQNLVNNLQGANAKPVYVLAEYAWSSNPTATAWESNYAQFSPALKAIGVNTVLQLGNYGWFIDVLSGAQLNALQEARAAQAMTNPAISPSAFDIEYVSTTNINNIPYANTPITGTGTFTNLSAEIAATTLLYQTGQISNTTPVNFSEDNIYLLEPVAPGLQSVPISLPIADWGFGSLSLSLSTQGDLLNATAAGAATVSGSNTTELILSGQPADIANELASVTVSSTSGGTDTIYMSIVRDNSTTVYAGGFTNAALPLRIQPTPLKDAAGTVAVVLLANTGLLTASSAGAATVTGNGTGELVLNGTPSDIAAELDSVTVTEPTAGSDTIDVETFGLYGQISDLTINVSSFAPVGNATAVAYAGSPGSVISSSAAGNLSVNGATIVTKPNMVLSAAGSNDTIYLNGYDSATVNGSGNTILLTPQDNLAVTGVATVFATSGTISLGSNPSAVILIGSANAVTLQSPSDALALLSGSGNSVTASGGTISVATGVTASVNGIVQPTIIVASGGIVSALGTDTIVGSGATVLGGSASNIEVASGGNLVSLTSPGGSVSLDSGVGNTVVANGGTISAAPGVIFAVSGSGNQITATSATSYVSGTNDTILTNGSALISASSNTTAHVSGTNGNTVLVGSNAVVTIDGADWVSIASGATVIGGLSCNLNVVNGGNTIILSGANDYAGLVSGSGSVVSATSAVVGAGANVAFFVSGNGNRVTATSATLGLSGSGNTVVANGGAVISGQNNTTFSLIGNNDTVTLGTNNSLTVSGHGNIIYSTQGGADVTFAAGSYGNTVYTPDGTIVKSDDFVLGAVDKLRNDIQQYSDASANDPNASSLSGLKAAGDSALGVPQSPFEGLHWATQTVTVSFGTVSNAFSDPLTSAEQNVVKQALAAWSRASGLRFLLVADSASADIRVGLGDFNTSKTGVLGLTSYVSGSSAFQPGVIVRAEDPTETPLTNQSGTAVYSGTEATFYQVMLHEIGHALGLSDNADPRSVMYYGAGQPNRDLNPTDLSNIAQLYQSLGAGRTPGLSQVSANETRLMVSSATAIGT